METTVVGPGTLTFLWKVSSEAGSDRLRFLINGSSQNNISGEVDWQQKTYSIAAGTNVLRWRYTKDAANSSGQDRGWVDQVVWLPSNTCTFSLSASNASLGASGGSTNVNVTAVSGSNCSWTADNPCSNWITVSPSNGTGNRQVTITVSANNTGISRDCTLTVAGGLLNIVQAAGTPLTIQVGDAAFGFSGGHFGFNITGSQGQTVVTEFSTDLQTWTPVLTRSPSR